MRFIYETWIMLPILLEVLLFFLTTVLGCNIPSEWHKTWRLNSSRRRLFSSSEMRDYTGSSFDLWQCDNFEDPTDNWYLVVFSTNQGRDVNCHRIYQDTNYMIFWTAPYPQTGASPYVASNCQDADLYENTMPEILLSEITEPQACFSTIPGIYYAQVSVSDTQTDICPEEYDSSRAVLTSTNIELTTCSITGNLACVGQLPSRYIGRLGDNVVFLRNESDPSQYYCARMHNDRDEMRVFLSVDYTQREEIVCAIDVDALTAKNTRTEQYRAFSLMRLFCLGQHACRNGATCRENNGIDFSCECQPGFNGIYCNHQIYCNPNPCRNGGRCDEGSTGPVCRCVNGYGGPTCESAACEAGTRLDPDWNDICLICPIGTYQSAAMATECIRCPDGKTTLQEQSTSARQCVPDCSAGKYILGSRCRKCPAGQYQPNTAQTSCISCPSGYITTQTGSVTLDQCIVMNPCDSSPCMGSSTCHADINGFKCACPDFKGGVFCEMDTVPEILSITPQYGPIAGGTVITIEGRNLQGDSTVEMYMGDIECTVLSRNETHIIIQTPMYNTANEAAFTRDSLEMNLNYAPSYEVPMQYQYTYLPNPQINDVTDLNTIATGGSPVTGMGKHMDSVAHPYLLVTLIYKNLQQTVPLTAYVITQKYTGPCTYSNSTYLKCTIPELELPEDLQEDLEHVISRRRRGVDDIRVFEGCDHLKGAPDEVEFYVDFVMDGLRTLEEDRELCVFEDPLLQEFVPPVQKYEQNERIVITGENMDIGLTHMHYQIDIGKGHCRDVELLSNSVSCKPPKSQPDIDKAGAYKEDAPRVVISVGENFRFHAGYLEYPSNPSYLVPVASACGAFVILVIIIIIILCCCHRNKKRMKKENALAKGIETGQSVRKNSSQNPLYTPTDDVNNNAVFVTTEGYLPPNTRMRQNSLYDVTSSTQVRFPSTSSDNTDELVPIASRDRSIRRNGTANGHVQRKRKSSVPTLKDKKSKASSKRRSATVPNRKSKKNPLVKKDSQVSIKETKNSKRFTRSDSVPSIKAKENVDIDQQYIRPVFVVNGTLHERIANGTDSTRVHVNGRPSAPYTVT